VIHLTAASSKEYIGITITEVAFCAPFMCILPLFAYSTLRSFFSLLHLILTVLPFRIPFLVLFGKYIVEGLIRIFQACNLFGFAL
jgi:hypothetical protein